MLSNSKNDLFRVFLVLFTCTIGTQLVRPAFSEDFQSIPIILKATEVIPRQLLRDHNYTVKEKITNDGVVSTYELETVYGPLMVENTVLLMKRIHELRALHKMEELQDSDVFAGAAKGAATGTFYTAKNLVVDPIGTVSEVGSGIGRFFKRISSGTLSNDPFQASTLASALGQVAMKRELAYKFGVDPYSSYRPLQETLDALAWTATHGSLTVKAFFSVLAVIPGGIAAVASLTSTADSLRSLVRDKTPSELQEINAGKLSAMGVSDSIAKIFLGNSSYNPSEQTLLVGELANIKAAKDRVMFIVAACYAKSEETAILMRVMAQLMGFYNERVEPIQGFIKADSLPLFEKVDGTVVAILPHDHLAWTQRFANMERTISDAIRRMSGIKGKELLVIGVIEPKARRFLEKRGWKVKEKFAEETIQGIMAKNMKEQKNGNGK